MSAVAAPPDLKIARGFSLPLDLVTEATAIVATRGAGKSSASAVIVEEGFAAGVQTVVFDRTGVYWGLRSNAKGDGPGLPIYVLGGPHADAPLEPHAGVLISDLVVDSGHSFVLDLSDFSKGQATRFAADFIEHLYDRKARHRSTLLLVMDEAHFYAPQTPRGGFKGDAARLMGAMEDAVGLGRSRGLGVVLTTQRTQALNKAVLDLIETLLVMRMLSPRARDAVQDWIREKHEDDREGVIATLESLPTGTAWVWSPLRGILEKVAVRRIRTFDSYDTPKPGQARVEPTVRRELDLGALGEQMRETAERAKENDPSELRRQLRAERDRAAGLSQQLEEWKERAAEGEVAADAEPRWQAYFRELGWLPPDEVPVPEAVPVLDESTLTSLSTILDRGESLAAQADEYAVGIRASFAQIAERVAEAKAPPAGRTEQAAAARSSPRPPRREGGDRSVTVAPVAPAVRPADGVTAPQQRILDALAWFEAIGVPHPRRVPTAAIAGVSAKSSGFRANVSTLSGLGLLRYPETGRLCLTDEGHRIARPPKATPTREALQEAVYAMLSRPQATLLRILVEAGEGVPVTREDLAAAAAVSPLSSGFRANVSTLSGWELVTYPSPGTVAADPILFP